MAWPSTPLTTYSAGIAPAIQAFDLNAFQSAINGIVNGTSNYLLTAMTDEGRAFGEVLAEAQKLGYAEADPTLDVDGWDAAHKLCVLVPLCFGQQRQLMQLGLRGSDHSIQQTREVPGHPLDGCRFK